MKEAWMMTKEELIDLKTLDEWLDEDRSIKKGSKALCFKHGEALFSREQTKRRPRVRRPNNNGLDPIEYGISVVDYF